MQSKILKSLPNVHNPNYLSPEWKQKQPNPISTNSTPGVLICTPTIVHHRKSIAPAYSPVVINLMPTSKPARLIKSYTTQLPPRQQVLIEEDNEEHDYQFDIQAMEGKKRLSLEVPIKRVFWKLLSLLALENRHYTLCIVPEKLREDSMELQHDEAPKEQNKDLCGYSTRRTAAIDEVKSMVNFVLSLNVSFLKMGGEPQYSRIYNKFMEFLTAKKLYINQLDTILEYAYEQVIAFTNSCCTNNVGQVQ